MGSVSRGRSRKGGWGGTPATDGMFAWLWLVGALLLLTLATASVARPPIVAGEEEEATFSEGKLSGESCQGGLHYYEGLYASDK